MRITAPLLGLLLAVSPLVAASPLVAPSPLVPRKGPNDKPAEDSQLWQHPDDIIPVDKLPECFRSCILDGDKWMAKSSAYDFCIWKYWKFQWWQNYIGMDCFVDRCGKREDRNPVWALWGQWGRDVCG